MAGTGLVAGEVVVDALPYFDQGYEAPGVREAAAALVEEETRRYRPTKNYLSYLTAPDYSAFETDIMRNEFERLAARQPIELLSMKRYELPAPSSGQKNDITAWQECVNNSMAQLEHQAVRIENLELMSQHGCNAWKVYNENLVHMIEHAQKELQKLRKHIQDLNWQRKNMQLTAGSKLREMESKHKSTKTKRMRNETTARNWRRWNANGRGVTDLTDAKKLNPKPTVRKQNMKVKKQFCCTLYTCTLELKV
ncbi:pre-mRNA-splicing factor SPF27 isoform X1 [Papio anubis]|uniref:Pre-mRNA-splicing factor SPF27 n=1 Tax=Papio anubis TaxID=9555 RepID=A0A2I3N2W6_PAPAN|nr:pre-mRNA-splicing factor SPF27 isoform X1 [Papio anubis]